MIDGCEEITKLRKTFYGIYNNTNRFPVTWTLPSNVYLAIQKVIDENSRQIHGLPIRNKDFSFKLYDVNIYEEKK